MKSFDEWFNGYENLQCDKDACEDAFEAGQQSKQAEVDELRKRLNMYEREGYKLAPVEPTKDMITLANEYYSESCSLSGLYKAMI